MIETFVAFCVFGPLRNREEGVKFHSDHERVEHGVFGIARVDASAFDLYSGSGSVETLIFDLAKFAAVNSISFFRAESLCVEVIRAAADLFVGRKGDADRPVREFGMRAVIGEKIHDLGDAGLVVRAKKRGAVGDDEIFPDVAKQLREVVGAHDHGVRTRVAAPKDDVPSAVISLDPGLYIFSACGGRRVHVSDETEGGFLPGEFRVDVAVFFIILRVDAHLTEFSVKKGRQVVLLRGGRLCAGVFGRLCVYFDISEKTVDKFPVCNHLMVLPVVSFFAFHDSTERTAMSYLSQFREEKRFL